MRRQKYTIFKSTVALILAGVVVLGGSRIVSAENHTYTWTVYNNGPGAVQEVQFVYLPYANSFSHYVKADSFSSTSEYNNVKVTGHNVYLYDVAEGCYKDYYRLSNTKTIKHFRPFSKTDDSVAESIIILDATHCFGTFAMTGRVWY